MSPAEFTAAREALGLDKRALAEALEISPNTVAALEAGRSEIRAIHRLALAQLAAKRSPTALAAFKGALLGAVGADADARTEAEARAYERCVDTGQAAIGREHFAEIRKGGVPPWGARSVENGVLGNSV